MSTTPIVLTIENAEQRLGILPQLGGSVANWDVARNGAWEAIWRQYAPPVGDNRTVGNFPLVPFSNRITGGGFTCDDVFYPMERNRSNSPFPIHGNGWMHDWEIVSHTATAIELAVESHKMHGYPWEYAARQRYSIEGNVMTMRLEVTHLGEKRLPYGLAFHPFQLRGNNPHGPRLQFKTTGVWLADEQCIPVENVSPQAEYYDFNNLRDLGHGKIDNNFSGWDGKMLMERPDIDLRLAWETTAPSGIDHCVLFRPEGQAFFCFEPITHITDAINRPGMPGMRLLQKGQSLALEVKQTLSRLG